MNGKLILAATPIGNLGDVSHRLLETLNKADEVWCEDTRVTRKLLAHFDINTRLRAFHEFSDEKTRQNIRNMLSTGGTMIYVSDAGMPGVSDPGFELVNMAREVDAEVDVLPGPSSVLNALVLSGFPCHQFVFLGFFPEKEQARMLLVQRLKNMFMTSIHFESPKRIRRTLQFLEKHIPDTRLAVCRELTKMHQETLIGTPSELQELLCVEKGEIVLVVEPVKECQPVESPEEYYNRLILEGKHPREALKQTSKTFRIKKRELYAKIVIQ